MKDYFMFFFQKWPEANFHISQRAGHSSGEPETRHLLLEATDKYKYLQHKDDEGFVEKLAFLCHGF